LGQPRTAVRREVNRNVGRMTMKTTKRTASDTNRPDMALLLHRGGGVFGEVSGDPTRRLTSGTAVVPRTAEFAEHR
jgi:hypothetical protein